jgi:hypothetical protein
MIFPDFLDWAPLNNLRSKMAAPLAESFAAISFKRIQLPLIEQLESDGIDINIEEISSLKDGTIQYRGHRVLLYIRDVKNYGGRSFTPRFHLTFCNTLRTKQRDQQMSKYVVATRNDGQFLVNTNEGNVAPSLMRLVVCQNCLADIAWKGFNMSQPRSSRTKQADEFTLKEYFTKYQRDLFGLKPEHDSDTSPRNEYPPDWPAISAAVKTRQGNRCESCTRHLLGADSRYLHAHHINGRRDESHEANLRVLCVKCHADQPDHGHLKSSVDYVNFIAKFG